MLKYILCLEGCFILSDKGYRCSKFSISPFFKNEKDDSLSIKLRPAEGIKNGLFVYLNGYIDTYNSSFFQKKITFCFVIKVAKVYISKDQNN